MMMMNAVIDKDDDDDDDDEFRMDFQYGFQYVVDAIQRSRLISENHQSLEDSDFSLEFQDRKIPGGVKLEDAGIYFISIYFLLISLLKSRSKFSSSEKNNKQNCTIIKKVY